MERANRIAVWVKTAIEEMPIKPNRILISFEILEVLRVNPEPCDPPDLVVDESGPVMCWRFCGVRVDIAHGWMSPGLSLVIDVTV